MNTLLGFIKIEKRTKKLQVTPIKKIRLESVSSQKKF